MLASLTLPCCCCSLRRSRGRPAPKSRSRALPRRGRRTGPPTSRPRKTRRRTGKATRRPKRKSRPSSRSTSSSSRAAARSATASRPGSCRSRTTRATSRRASSSWRTRSTAAAVPRRGRSCSRSTAARARRRCGCTSGRSVRSASRCARTAPCRRRPTGWSTTTTPGSTRPTSCSSTRSGTGYSRPAKPELGRKFWGVQGDIESVGEFIRLYLTRHERWGSPLFLVGESYGTTRAAGLAGHLVDRGIAFNGILLVSSILNFQTARFTQGNDLPYPLFLPTYAATAWYHKKLPADLQSKPLGDFLREVTAFAGGDYPSALHEGRPVEPGRAAGGREAPRALHRALGDVRGRGRPAHRDPALLQGAAAARAAHRRPARLALQGHRRERRQRAARVRPVDDGDPSALHRGLQRLRAPRARLQDRHRLPHPRRRDRHAVGLRLGQRLRRHLRGARAAPSRRTPT